MVGLTADILKKHVIRLVEVQMKLSRVFRTINQLFSIFVHCSLSRMFSWEKNVTKLGDSRVMSSPVLCALSCTESLSCGASSYHTQDRLCTRAIVSIARTALTLLTCQTFRCPASTLTTTPPTPTSRRLTSSSSPPTPRPAPHWGSSSRTRRTTASSCILLHFSVLFPIFLLLNSSTSLSPSFAPSLASSSLPGPGPW